MITFDGHANDAARFLEYSQEYIRALVARGALPERRLSNGHLVFTREDLERFARERCR